MPRRRSSSNWRTSSPPPPPLAPHSLPPRSPTHTTSRLQWGTAPAAALRSLVLFTLPEGQELELLRLSSQRPLCLPDSTLACCHELNVSGRRIFLGLPPHRDAPWAPPLELCARFAQVRRLTAGRGGSALVLRAPAPPDPLPARPC